MKKKFKEYYNRIIKRENFVAFVLMYLVALICFLVTAKSNSFTLPMYGDYHMQTYAFYAQGYNLFWDFVKHGKTAPMFDFSNFLGSNYYGSQSFYYTFSPLFYLLCLWPRKFLYQGILFHMVFKYALGGFFFYILLKKYFHVSTKMSWAGGFAYCLSGYSLFYLWFHFSDIVALFPLFLMGVEKLLKERKGWLLTLGLFLIGITNYFFLINFSIFGFFYSVYRWVYIYGISKKRGYNAKTRWSVLFQGMLYYATGIIMTFFVLFPSLNVAMGISRTQTPYLTDFLSFFFQDPKRENGSLILGSLKPLKEILSKDNLVAFFKYLTIWQDRTLGSNTIKPYQQTGYLISNWLFMNTSCWNSTSFNVASLDNSNGGLFVTTPLTIMLIPCIIQTIKRHRPWEIFGVIMGIIIPFLPITTYIAFGFTSLYGRWEIWVTAVAILYIIPTIDKFEVVDRRFVTLGLIFNYILCGYMLVISQKDPAMKPTKDMLSVISGEMILMLVVWAIYRFKIFKIELVKRIMLVIIVAEVGVSTTVTIEHKGYYKWDNYYMSQDSYDEMEDIIANLKEEDASFYRIYNAAATKLYVNLPSTLSYNGQSTFNSTYDLELNDFIRRSKMWYNGGWTMGYHEKRYYLDQYLGIKYYITNKIDINNDNYDYGKDLTIPFDGKNWEVEYDENGNYQNKLSARQDYNENIPWGYELVNDNYKYYRVYKNTNHLGIGYMVDSIISSSTVGTNSYATYYEKLYSDAAIIESDKIDEIQEKGNLNKLTSYSDGYEYVSQSSWDKYFSPREDYEKRDNQNVIAARKEHKLSNGNISKSEISKILPSNSQFFHKRWEEKNRLGDQIILKMNGNSVCPLATENNKCYINFSFKMGPRVLISMYNDDVLVTQDAHMVSTASLSTTSYEWKTQRGFYVNQPINKIVIEFVQDTAYDKVFNSGNSIPTMSTYYQYQSKIYQTYEKIKSNLLYDVNYKKDTFTFKTNTNEDKIAVTTIPYDTGWTLKNKKDGSVIEIFNVNGGFIGFIPLKGENEYELSYYTPYLNEGIVCSLFGLLMFIALNYVYSRKRINILEIENVKEYQYRKNNKEYCDDYLKDFIKNVKQIPSKCKEFILKLFKQEK